MDLLAYALRADYEGETEVELADGTKETRPTFGGGVLAVGDGDFHVADSLALNDGRIVVLAHDQQLVDLLDQYPPLKRTNVPAKAVVVSPYERRQTEALRQLGSLRDVTGAASLSRKRLIAALEAQDAAIHDAAQTVVDAIGDNPDDADAIADAAGVETPDTTGQEA